MAIPGAGRLRSTFGKLHPAQTIRQGAAGALAAARRHYERGARVSRPNYLNEATSAERHSAGDRFPSRRGVQYSAIFSRQPAPHRFV